jgi:DNA-binding NtrC family response regulator
VRVDVRIVAATNRSLEDMVAEGAFRSDLYYRLAVVHVRLPPLRERLSDVPLLVDHFLDRIRSENSLGQIMIEPDALEILSRHSYPGNVRELSNIVRRASLLGDRRTITAADLAAEVRSVTARSEISAQDWSGLRFKEAKSRLLDHFEREYLEHVLRRHHFNVSSAAREAGIGRRHFHRLLEKYGISARKDP